MLTVDLTHVPLSPDSRYILRLRDRVTHASQALGLVAGKRLEVSSDALPGPLNQTVAWVDEVTGDGETNPMTPRVRADGLKHVAHLEIWLRQPAKTTTHEEAEKMLQTLVAWEYFGDSEWENRVMRIAKDVLRKLRRIRRLPANSRLAVLCELYSAGADFSDSVTGNVMASLAGMTALHGLVERHVAPIRRDVFHVTSPTDNAASEALKSDLRHLLATSSAFNGSSTTSSLLRGQVLSVIESRNAARREFQSALSANRHLVKSLYLDMGSFTYGSSKSGFAQAATITWHGADYAPKAEATILYSANTDFLRRFLARILFYAIAEPELHLHFHLVATEKEALAFIGEAEELLSTIHAFSGRASTPPRLSWSSSEVPAGVGNPITYFACARYLVAEAVMDKFGTDIWVQDVDLYPTAPISQAHTSMTGFDAVVAASSGIDMLAPWRRYIANSVYISRSENGRTFASNAAAYISSFLHEPDSWMLDQNALDWAVEMAPAGTSIGNMRALDVQLTQSAMNGPIES